MLQFNTEKYKATNPNSFDRTLITLSSGKEGLYIILPTHLLYRVFEYTLTVHRADSGFNHVEPEKYTARLLHIKGRKVQ